MALPSLKSKRSNSSKKKITTKGPSSKKLSLKKSSSSIKYNIILYQDRNIKDERINEGFKSIYKGLKIKYPNLSILFLKFCDFKLINCDYAFIWNAQSYAKSCTNYRKQVIDYQKKNNNKTIVIELGFINRSLYYSIGFNHISNFGSYPKFPDDLNRLNKLNISIKNINYDNNPNRHILFCTQVPWDTQVQDIDYNKWIIDSLNELKKYTKRKILVRTHPKHKTKKGYCKYDDNFFNKNNLKVDISNNTLEEDFKNCYCVIAYNSTILVDAIISGIPIISGSDTSIVSDITIKDFSKIENLPKILQIKIVKCLALVAYKQWNVDEIINGEPFEYYIKY